jgi:asparagine synthetase B (glutamine-hydrolysing)
VKGSWVARVDGTCLELVEQGDAEFAEREDICVVFGGHLYQGAHLVEGAAVEVIDAYRRSGESSLSKLRGDYAFALFDRRRNAALCVRDPIGIHPLFTAETADALLLSPSIDALLAQPAVSRAINLPALADHLRYRWPDPTETYFEVVRRIPAGHVLHIRGGATSVYRYWHPAPPGQPMPWIQEDEVGLLEELLDQAVKRGLARGRAAVFLSGGLDSVSIAAVAAATPAPPPLALSLVFPDADVNEERVQRQVARDLGLDQVLLYWDQAIGEGGLFAAALELNRRLPNPLTNFWAPVYERLAAEGRDRGCAVILTGTGGDEWLGVSPFYAADLIRRGDLIGLSRLWWSQRRSFPLSELHLLRNTVWKFGLRPLVVEAAGRVAPTALYRRRVEKTRLIPPWLAPSGDLRREIVARAERDVEHPGRRPRPTGNRREPRAYIREMRRPLDHPLVSLELEETFEQGRRLGLTILAPYWDGDVLELLYRTPPHLLNTGHRAKGLVRQMLARRFPEIGFERQKKVVATRFSTALLLTEGPHVWKSIGSLTALAEAGIVEGKAASEVVERAFTKPSGPRDVYTGWNLVTSECWLRSRL